VYLIDYEMRFFKLSKKKTCLVFEDEEEIRLVKELCHQAFAEIPEDHVEEFCNKIFDLLKDEE
jgi:The ARF-like 2 binding protein BART.